MTETVWTFRSRRSGHERQTRLWLIAEIDGTPMSDNYTPAEISASDLFRRWHDKHVHDTGWVTIYWHVEEAGETAPFQEGDWPEDFLTHWTWPVDEQGERLNWNR